MFYKSIFLTVLLFSYNNIYSQQDTSYFPNGVYLSVEQLKAKTPAYKANLKAHKSVLVGNGYDYLVVSNQDSLKPKEIKKM